MRTDGARRPYVSSNKRINPHWTQAGLFWGIFDVKLCVCGDVLPLMWFSHYDLCSILSLGFPLIVHNAFIGVFLV